MTSIQPELWVDSPRDALTFYQAAFGATVLHLVGVGDDVVAQLGVGEAAFWVAPASSTMKRLSPRSVDGATSRTLLVVDDPGTVVRQAVAAGATQTSPVGDEHGWRLGRIVDPFGHEWEIGTPLGSWPPGWTTGGPVPADQPARHPALQRLDALVGEWTVETSLGPAAGRAVFEWALGGWFLVQRSEVPDVPEAPDGLLIVGLDHDGQGYTQHYFDSRGVARLYRMTFSDGVWTLLREAPDFTPLDFRQRFVGELSADGRTITGRWESSTDGSTWELDFDLTYRKLT